MRYLLLLIAAPGSFALIGYALHSALQMVRSWKEDDEDAARVLRIQREYDVPEDAVALPTGKRIARREWPEITSNYKDVGVR